MREWGEQNREKTREDLRVEDVSMLEVEEREVEEGDRLEGFVEAQSFTQYANRRKDYVSELYGSKSREFFCEMKDLMKEHRPQEIILLEPRISGEIADDLCKKLGKKL